MYLLMLMHEILYYQISKAIYTRFVTVFKGCGDISKRRFIYATLMFVPYGIRRGLADRTALYFRSFACKAASFVISGSIREGKLQ